MKKFTIILLTHAFFGSQAQESFRKIWPEFIPALAVCKSDNEIIIGNGTMPDDYYDYNFPKMLSFNQNFELNWDQNFFSRKRRYLRKWRKFYYRLIGAPIRN